ncbi:HlyD family efflux transporter periplasmic adaptor subunit [Variovorax sp. H27-G14]|uniref:HlyD family efflux transporter periplasmic adaptor subunit n=1 Tax=Variovorax sp. H27-G14 TaxID=3111914 RepID=UPI0038FC49AF
MEMMAGNAMAPPPLSTLPPLRQELAIHPGPTDADGVPSWTLHDPIDNRFFQIGWPAFEILSRWSLREAAKVLAAIRQDTTLAVSQADIEAVFAFLRHHHLLVARSAEDNTRLAHYANATRMSHAMWLLKHYLFFRIPLVRPMPFLRAMLPRIGWVFTPRFWWAMLGVGALGLYLVAQQWDSFMHQFAGYSSWQGVLAIGLALSVAKVAHELGHAFTAYRYGCRVPNMGVAFMVMVPMLYTDTNEAWKLPSRRARLFISSAGMAAELALAAVATLLWNFLPDGPVRAGVFLLATSTWLVTLAINLSPFMRFDGYFLMCDWLEVPNLHERAFALGRWRLREWLFGWGEPPPETFAPRRQRGLVVFAYAVWVYRLVLFLGIAFLVYSLFFKALGVLLLAVELGWFIARPVQKEVAVWWQQRTRMRLNRQTLRSAALALVALLVVLVPWPRGVEAPAVLGAQQAQWLYAPAPAQVQGMQVAVHQSVKAEQVLLTLDSSDLRRQLGLAQAREQQLRWQLEQQPFSERLQQNGAGLLQRLEGAKEEVAGLVALNQQLQLRASFDGVVVSLNSALQPGVWVARGERLVQVAAPEGVKVDAYVEEAFLPRIEAGASARFIADEPGVPRVDCRVQSVDRIALPSVEHLALTSPYGGPIPAKLDGNGVAQPHDARFRVRLHECTGLPGTGRERTGSAVIGNSHQSFAGQWLRQLAAVLHREGGL